MTANFLNLAGSCFGIDGHTFIAAAGPAPAPVPLVPHVVFAIHAGPSREWRVARTVTMDGTAALQGNWAMLLLNHMPIPPGLPPHALEVVNLVAIILAGSAAPQLTAHTVTAEGGALLTAISGSQGLNLDCSDFPAFSNDVNPNTVMTNPTLGDYLSAALSTALSWFYAWLASKAGAKTFKDPTAGEIGGGAVASVATAIAQTILDFVNANFPDGFILNLGWGDPIANAIGKAAALVQGLVDGAAQ